MSKKDALGKLYAESVQPQIIVAQAKPVCGDTDYQGCDGNDEIGCCDGDGTVPNEMPCALTANWYHVPASSPDTSLCVGEAGNTQMCWVGNDIAGPLQYPIEFASRGGWYGTGTFKGFSFKLWLLCRNTVYGMYIRWSAGQPFPTCDPYGPHASGGDSVTGWQCFNTCNSGFLSCSAQTECPPTLPFRITCATSVVSCLNTCWYMRVEIRP